MISEEFEKTQMEIIKSLEERGYNPYEQLKGYVSLGDDSYITRHGDAREKIKNLDREKISNYLREKGW